jgi:hypothetical protein
MKKLITILSIIGLTMGAADAALFSSSEKKPKAEIKTAGVARAAVKPTATKKTVAAKLTPKATVKKSVAKPAAATAARSASTPKVEAVAKPVAADNSANTAAISGVQNKVDNIGDSVAEIQTRVADLETVASGLNKIALTEEKDGAIDLGGMKLLVDTPPVPEMN